MNDGFNRFVLGLIRYAEYLPSDEEHPLEVIVLKWHLIIEEELRELVLEKFVDKKAFDLNQTKYATLLRLARALHGDALKPWHWDIAFQLNTVRNSLAHSLRDDTLLPRINDNIFSVFDKEDSTFAFTVRTLTEKLGYCFAYIHFEILRLRHIS